MTDKNYDHYPRVTQILRETKPKEELKRLQKRIESDADGSLKERDKARTNEGTLIHQFGFEYLSCDRTQEPEVPEHLLSYWTPFKAVLDSMAGTAAGLETPIYNHTLKYRGTPDARLYFPETDTHALLDFKTFEGYDLPWKGDGERQTTWPVWRCAKDVPQDETERGFEHLHYRFRDALIQCCLYRLAFIDMDMPVDEIWVAVITRDSGVQLLQLQPSWWEECKRQGIERVREYHRIFPLDEDNDDLPF